MKNSLLNFLLFQIGWFACVYSGAAGLPWIGSIIALAIIAAHLWGAANPKAEFKLIAIAVLIGTLWDSFLVAQGLLIYSSGILVASMAPYWILIMWALFATTLNLSLSWLKGRWLAAVLLGAIGGPFAYWIGQRMGAVEFADTGRAMLWLLAGWALATPLLTALSQRFNGYVLAEVRS